MSASKRPAKVDNSSPELKAELRRRLLAELTTPPRVCDLFCGTGQMYQRAYAGNVAEYVGIDHETIHDPKLCLLMDNRQYVGAHDLTRFDVFDLDAYGSPWALYWRILERAGPGPLTIFLTDGTPERLRMNATGSGTKIMSAVNQVPKGMKIPVAFRFYHAMVKTLLLAAGEHSGWQVMGGLHGMNSYKSVCYWGLRLERSGDAPGQM